MSYSSTNSLMAVKSNKIISKGNWSYYTSDSSIIPAAKVLLLDGTVKECSPISAQKAYFNGIEEKWGVQFYSIFWKRQANNMTNLDIIYKPFFPSELTSFTLPSDIIVLAENTTTRPITSIYFYSIGEKQGDLTINTTGVARQILPKNTSYIIIPLSKTDSDEKVFFWSKYETGKYIFNSRNAEQLTSGYNSLMLSGETLDYQIIINNIQAERRYPLKLNYYEDSTGAGAFADGWFDFWVDSNEKASGTNGIVLSFSHINAVPGSWNFTYTTLNGQTTTKVINDNNSTITIDASTILSKSWDE